MSNKEIFEKVKEMNLPIGQYAIFGSGPMGVRGLKICEDADLIVSKELWDKYKSDPGWKLKTAACGTDGLCNGLVEFYYIWKPGEWDADQLIADAEMIDGLPFVKLKYVLEWKKIYNREKDLKDIKIIENYLK